MDMVREGKLIEIDIKCDYLKFSEFIAFNSNQQSEMKGNAFSWLDESFTLCDIMWDMRRRTLSNHRGPHRPSFIQSMLRKKNLIIQKCWGTI